MEKGGKKQKSRAKAVKKSPATRARPVKQADFDLTDEELMQDEKGQAQGGRTKRKSQKKSKKAWSKKRKVLFGLGIFLLLVLVAAIAVILVMVCQRKEDTCAKKGESPEPIYSVLTGLEIDDATLNSQPTYCAQISNGSLDGARPQAGLNQAGVVFEAIAERGITRFAAVFQNPSVSAIGPVRSLRPYYLDWDTPFDCTIVHAGGSDEALAEVSNGNFRDLDIDSGIYAWREDDYRRSWNNLFTSTAYLKAASEDAGHTSSDVKAFARMTPDEAANLVTERQDCLSRQDDSDGDGEACVLDTPEVSEFSILFGSDPDYNTVYRYDSETNTYARTYANGEPHLVYDCAGSLTEPYTRTECGDEVQIAPSVVVAMLVDQNTMADGYHEQIDTDSAGVAYIFQNGTVIEGTWRKDSQGSQISFRDSADNEIPLTPGQLWIAAIPGYGGVEF